MRRVAGIVLLLVALAAVVVGLSASSNDKSSKPQFYVEVDNAFGLQKGGDLKIAGVRAGKVTSLGLDRHTRHARVGFNIAENGFGSLRRDVRCAVKPQSLIGEYFLDCLPGTDRRTLPEGSTIPVSRTSSTIPPDLVQDILRRPQQERLSLIISALGAGVAGNSKNLNDAIRRAVPALTQTDMVLATLARQSNTLAELTRNGDKVITDLAGNRGDVGRWVVEARNISTDTADRRKALAEGFRRLPGFLEQLRPTMRDLGAVADAQGAALTDVDASAKQLTRFFGLLGPFADASRPAVRSLGSASRVGSKAVASATPTVAKLNTFAKGTPELGKNLAIILEHLDDPGAAAEYDPRAAAQTGRPAPTGYTGLEALLQYTFDQTLSTNIFDQSNHILAIAPFPGECADYADAARAKDLAAKGQKCAANLGPDQPGVTSPDPTAPGNAGAKARGAARLKLPSGKDVLPTAAPAAPATSAAPASAAAASTATSDAALLRPRTGHPDQATQGRLLDYLLGG